MTLKEELEILRGEPIRVFEGDPMDIPCCETSDSDRLCKHPVVSVHMITYNHEPYIRQAIEGVMMQKTDFEFELVIGEDCSKDRTREICFEYQKKYPDKIRVLWWQENVSKFGGNERRVTARCRGEYVAICEGDDYWTDPFKLQKQVDIMSRYQSVSLCFTDGVICFESSGERCKWRDLHSLDAGVLEGRTFALRHMFGINDGRDKSPLTINTASALYRKSKFSDALSRFEIFKMGLALGDSILWLGLSLVGDVYYLPDSTMVYRQNSTGAMQRYGRKVCFDAQLVRAYYAIRGLGLPATDWPVWFLDALTHQFVISLSKQERVDRNNTLRLLVSSKNFGYIMLRPKAKPVYLCVRLGLCNPKIFERIGQTLRGVSKLLIR